MSERDTEVLVTGGGPAGAALARQLARLGHEVCVVERALFPRPHVGESLPPRILPLLEALGVRGAVESAGFLRPDRAVVCWAEPTDALKSQPGPPGFQVDRGRFDALLLAAAREAGVRVLQAAAALRPRRLASGGWEIPVRSGGSLETVRARFIADASGRRRWLPGRAVRSSPATLALYGYWRDAAISGPETRVEAGPDEWFWGAPLPDGTFNAAVFLDPDRMAGARGRELEGLYRSLLEGSRLLAGCLRGRLEGGVLACDASCHAVDPVGPDWIRVGEASFTLDPLSSQGVQAAIRSGLQAAAVLHTLLRSPGDAPAAREFYRSRQAEAVAQHQRIAAGYYAEPVAGRERPFWQRRASAGQDVDAQPVATPARALPATDAAAAFQWPVALSPEARLVEVPCLVDGRITARRALAHPHLERPVAFLGGFELAPLLDDMASGEPVAALVRRWARRIPPRDAARVARWLLSSGVLLPDPPPRVHVRTGSQPPRYPAAEYEGRTAR